MKRNLKKFWCGFFGHCYRFLGYKPTKLIKNGPFSSFGQTLWECEKCKKKKLLDGEVVDNTKLKGDLYL